MLQGAIPYFKVNVEQGGSTWKQELSLTRSRICLLGQGCDASGQLAALTFIGKAIEEFKHNNYDLVNDLINDFEVN